MWIFGVKKKRGIHVAYHFQLESGASGLGSSRAELRAKEMTTTELDKITEVIRIRLTHDARIGSAGNTASIVILSWQEIILD